MIMNILIINILCLKISVCDSSLVVRMDASQAFDPGSSPGYRTKFFFKLLKPIPKDNIF